MVEGELDRFDSGSLLIGLIQHPVPHGGVRLPIARSDLQLSWVCCWTLFFSPRADSGCMCYVLLNSKRGRNAMCFGAGQNRLSDVIIAVLSSCPASGTALSCESNGNECVSETEGRLAQWACAWASG